MKTYTLTQAHIRSYVRSLKEEEKAQATIEKYSGTLRGFFIWLEGRQVTREAVAQWKAYLLEKGQAPSAVNAKLSAANSLFRFLGWKNCQVKFLKLQKRAFRDSSKDLTREEYSRLLKTANAMQAEWLALLMETICATGIRVSEVKYITVEAIRSRRAEGYLKGKIRTILIPEKLCRKLKKIRRKEKNRLRRNLSIRRRKELITISNLESHESYLRKRRGGGFKSISAQSAPPVCSHLLSGYPGYCKAGRYTGPQLRGNHPHLPYGYRRGACPPVRTAGACQLMDTESVFCSKAERRPQIFR